MAPHPPSSCIASVIQDKETVQAGGRGSADHRPSPPRTTPTRPPYPNPPRRRGPTPPARATSLFHPEHATPERRYCQLPRPIKADRRIPKGVSTDNAAPANAANRLPGQPRPRSRTLNISGGGGIRTRVAGLPQSCFQDSRLRPLGHPSRVSDSAIPVLEGRDGGSSGGRGGGGVRTTVLALLRST